MGHRVAVLGAGPMGLAAAYQLAKAGYEPVVFEADSVVGGMAATFDFGGIEIERYYHFYCLSDQDLFRILEEMNLSSIVHWSHTTMGYWFKGRIQKWGDPVALLRFRGLNLISKFRYGLHVLACTRRNNWERLDRLDAKQWIRKMVGKRAYDILWSDLFDFKFYDQSDNVSAAWIWSRIRRIGRSRDSMFKERLGFIERGSQTLLNAMSEQIVARGGKILLRTPVTKVHVVGGEVTGVDAGGEFHEFDRVISTVPLPYLAGLFPDIEDSYLELITSKKNIAVVCVIVRLKKQVSPHFWVNTKDPEMDIPGFVEYSNLRPCENAIVYVPFYLPVEHPTYAETDEEFQLKVTRYLKKINPRLIDEDFIDFRVNRYRYAQPICEPGYLEHLPPLDLGVRGVLASDTSYYYPEDRGLSESIGFGRRLADRMICGGD